jgi:LmbE family N-acetylglucosaminyl deacetylase
LKNVLVIAPHPDDETLGCGGTLLKHKKNKDNIFWLIITNISIKDGWAKHRVIQRQKEIDKVKKLYKFNNYFKLDYPTAKLDQIPRQDLVSKISKTISIVKPNIVYLNNHSDIHTDHQITFEAVMSATKNFRSPSIKKILMYETLSETEFAPPLNGLTFVPNVFNDITPFFSKKIDILKTYKSEIMKDYFPRSLSSVKSLASIRGSKIGVKYAESFCLLHEFM